MVFIAASFSRVSEVQIGLWLIGMLRRNNEFRIASLKKQAIVRITSQSKMQLISQTLTMSQLYQ
jgi:hypothetical protein